MGMSYEFQDQVLGMVVNQPKRYWPLVKNKWNPDAFVHLDRIKLAKAIQQVMESGAEFNIALLRENLNGDAAIMLLGVINDYIREVNIEWFIDQLNAWHNLKNLVPEMGDLASQLMRTTNLDRPETFVAKFKELYEKSEKAHVVSEKLHTMPAMIESTIKRIEDRIIQRSQGKIRGYSMGLKTLDDIMGGFIPGRFYIIAARTSVGKTSFATYMALKSILQNAKPLFFSNEMDKEDLIEKFVAADGKIETNKFQSGELTDQELSRLTASANKLATFRAVIDEKNGWDLDALISKTHKLHRTGQCDMVFVDYLQQVRVKSAKTKYEQVSIVSDAMKRLSRELSIPVIGLAQINRESEKGQTKELPSLSNLKDSGSLEQDADVVMILHKNDIADQNVVLSIAKNRYGMTCATKLKHIHQYNIYEQV